MRKYINMLGMSALITALILPFMLVVAELQYWTAEAFKEVVEDGSGGPITAMSSLYDAPAVMFNIAGTSTATTLSVVAAISAITSAVLLMGNRWLLAVSFVWIVLGACLGGHLYAGLNNGWWLLVAIVTGVSAFLPEVRMYRKPAVPSTIPDDSIVH